MLPASRSADDSLILRQVDHNWEGHACRARLEGRACHARSEGHVYRARWSKIDNPMLRSGPDERVPPGVGGARLSCPMKRDGWSEVIRRTRQARPSEGRRGTLVMLAEWGW